MNKKRNGIKEINKVCLSVMELTDEDFAQVREMAEKQSGYTHPFKNATAQKQHELGDHNTRVVNALFDLRDIIRGNERTE